MDKKEVMVTGSFSPLNFPGPTNQHTAPSPTFLLSSQTQLRLLREIKSSHQGGGSMRMSHQQLTGQHAEAPRHPDHRPDSHLRSSHNEESWAVPPSTEL